MLPFIASTAGVPILSNISDFASRFFSSLFSGDTVSTILGVVGGGAFLATGAFLLLKNAISGDEGFKTLKKMALISLVPISLVALAQVINFTNLQTALTNFFIIIRRLLIVFDFAIDTDLLISLLLTTFGISVAYWVYRAYKFVITFFNER